MEKVNMIGQILLILGGVNTGLDAVAGVDVIHNLLGSMPMVGKVVYGLVGVAGVNAAYNMITKKG